MGKSLEGELLNFSPPLTQNDKGICGTSTKKRDDLYQMIADAKTGRYDFIITKETSRFPGKYAGQHQIHAGASRAQRRRAVSKRHMVLP